MLWEEAAATGNTVRLPCRMGGNTLYPDVKGTSPPVQGVTKIAAAANNASTRIGIHIFKLMLVLQGGRGTLRHPRGGRFPGVSLFQP